MSVYRKKPIEVQAIKWLPSNRAEIFDLLEGAKGDFLFDTDSIGESLYLETIDDNLVVVPLGGYVVIDAKGYPYPCDAEIFEAGHELVSP